MRNIITGLITLYQTYLSFDRGLLRAFAPSGACRYEVSCSEYTKQAIQEVGVLKGGWLGVKRILACNPWS